MWIVPIAVARRIACVVVIQESAGKGLEAIEFGKIFLANRIGAAIKLLEGTESRSGGQFRLLSFFDPTVDLFLQKTNEGRWRWINLQGTVEAHATEMSAPEIENFLAEVRKAKEPHP